MFILGLECVTQLVRGKLLAQNVFYDPLLLDVGKPLCDESGDISPGDINHRKQQEDFGNVDFRILNRITPVLSLQGRGKNTIIRSSFEEQCRTIPKLGGQVPELQPGYKQR